MLCCHKCVTLNLLWSHCLLCRRLWCLFVERGHRGKSSNSKLCNNTGHRLVYLFKGTQASSKVLGINWQNIEHLWTSWRVDVSPSGSPCHWCRRWLGPKYWKPTLQELQEINTLSPTPQFKAIYTCLEITFQKFFYCYIRKELNLWFVCSIFL